MSEDLIKKAMEEQATESDDGRSTDFGYYHLANKIDTQMGEVRQEFKSEISGLRQEMKSDINSLRQEMKSDINSLRQEINSQGNNLSNRIDSLGGRIDSLQRWTIGTIVAIVVGFAGVIATIIVTAKAAM